MSSLAGFLSLPWMQRAIRFGISGLLVTLVHIAVASAWMRWAIAQPAIANGVAFCVANAFSYVIHTLWSFSTKMAPQVLAKFLTVSGLGLALSVGLAQSVDWLGLPYGYGIAVVVLVIPTFNFLFHHFWTYAKPPLPATGGISPKHYKDL